MKFILILFLDLVFIVFEDMVYVDFKLVIYMVCLKYWRDEVEDIVLLFVFVMVVEVFLVL